MGFLTGIVTSTYRYYRFLLKGIPPIPGVKDIGIRIEMDFENPKGLTEMNFENPKGSIAMNFENPKGFVVLDFPNLKETTVTP